MPIFTPELKALISELQAERRRVPNIDGLVLTMDGQPIDKHRTRPETMQELLDSITAKYDGVGGWLRSNGWTDQDSAALRAHLLDG